MTPFLAKLGLNDQDRALIVHADDVGLCQASLSAFAELVSSIGVTSGSVMVPSGWFPAVAGFCRANPEVDMGVHLTLTCEWNAYRWGPISRGPASETLLDAESYLPRTIQQLWQQADPDAVFREVNAQLDRAIAAGINVTHLDDHMAALIQPEWLRRFVDTALNRRLPMRHQRPQLESSPLDEWAQANRTTLIQAEARGLRLLDHCFGLEAGSAADKLAQLQQIVSTLPAGSLSLIFAHPAHDTPELRAIAPDWPNRVADFVVLSSRAGQAAIRDAGIQLIGFAPLRSELPVSSDISTIPER